MTKDLYLTRVSNRSMRDIITIGGISHESRTLLFVLSLLLPLIAILLAFKTKQVIPSLFIAILMGATIISEGNPLVGFAKILNSKRQPII